MKTRCCLVMKNAPLGSLYSAIERLIKTLSAAAFTRSHLNYQLFVLQTATEVANLLICMYQKCVLTLHDFPDLSAGYRLIRGCNDSSHAERDEPMSHTTLRPSRRQTSAYRSGLVQALVPLFPDLCFVLFLFPPLLFCDRPTSQITGTTSGWLASRRARRPSWARMQLTWASSRSRWGSSPWTEWPEALAAQSALLHNVE